MLTSLDGNLNSIRNTNTNPLIRQAYITTIHMANYHHQGYYQHPQYTHYGAPPRWPGYAHQPPPQYMAPSTTRDGTALSTTIPNGRIIGASTARHGTGNSTSTTITRSCFRPHGRPLLHTFPHTQFHTPAAPPSPAPTPKQELSAAVTDLEQAAPVVVSQSASESWRQSQVQIAPSPLSLLPETRMPFYPTLPWYSTEEGFAAFPPRATPSRRRRQNLVQPTEVVALPPRRVPEGQSDTHALSTDDLQSEVSTIAAPSEPTELETPATSQAPSEDDFTHVSTPATPAQIAAPSPKVTPTPQQIRRNTRSAIAVPNLPALSKAKASPPAVAKSAPPSSQSSEIILVAEESKVVVEPRVEMSEEAEEIMTPPSTQTGPKSWADMVRKDVLVNKLVQPNVATANRSTILPKSASLADALKQYNVATDLTLSFIEPRGLVNTGNMCYMNSILQVLMFCTPFYSFLDQVRQRTVHSMKSDTPLVDAMIMFMREFEVLASADSVETLRKVLKQEQLEQYGDPVTPEYVYDAIRKLPRFQTMRRGHQQDAEEFLGFLLEGLHGECLSVVRGQVDERAHEHHLSTADSYTSPTSGEGWLEVGPRQKASTTRTAGQDDAPSPVTKIFGGYLRSELRVQGLKDSVTREPYQPLQLDIGAPNVNNIVDALKGLTRTEPLIGDFGGKAGTTAKKQVFIDTLPPVLILHLKRFQYDNNFTGTQKIWKKVGYPLELEIPKEVFPPAKRGGLAVQGGLPKYRLISVVYHHGKSAAGGHYTVDVLRADGREWIRLDDTIIRRVRPEDVAEGGAEEDPKVLAKALEQHKADQDLQKQRNMYQGLDEAEQELEEDKPWSEVNGVAGKKWNASVAATNGTATPTGTAGKHTPTAKKDGVKDNKVAYILLYEKIRD